MRMRRYLAGLLAVALLLGGCASSAPAPAPTAAPETAAAETTIEETAYEAATEAEETVTAEIPTEAVLSEEEFETFLNNEGEELLMSLLPVGDITELVPLEEGNELSAEEAEEMDRAMRAYTPPKDSLLINKAKNYYYYSKLDDASKELYDTILMGTEDPEYATSRALLITDRNPFDDAFWDWYNIAATAVMLDHPERFWMYSHQPSRPWASYRRSDIPGKYEVYIYLNEPVKDYRARQTAFNEAAKSFLKGIDTSKSKKEVARKIHDKLVDMVSYDHPVCDKNISDDVAHTAYGALVASSSGKKNHAVCDGYALAFEYLCQQVGIEATVITGMAGSTPKSSGAHAWSMVKVEDKWQEVDACWDDVGTLAEKLDKNSKYYKYYKEALSSDKYVNYLKHHMYCITTSLMRNFSVSKKNYYKTKNGKYTLSLIGESVHIRDKQGERGWGDVVCMAPTAK